MEQQKNSKKSLEFSKTLLIQESLLIWITTISLLVLAFYCVSNQYFSELPWIATMCGFPWTAYGVSQACYYRKAEKENTRGGIKYDSIFYQGEHIEHAEDHTEQTYETKIYG